MSSMASMASTASSASSPAALSMNHTVCEEKDFLPVSKFSKYHSHLVCSNEHFIVYTPSKRGIVRVIRQENGSHIALNTHFSSGINTLYIWETGASTSLLTIGSDEGKIAIWEVKYPSASDAPREETENENESFVLKQTLSLPQNASGSNSICKSIAGTRYFTFSVHDSIYLYRIPQGPSDQTSAGRSAVIKFDGEITDFDFHPDACHLSVCTSDGVLWACEFSLSDLLEHKFVLYSDLKATSTTVLPDISKVWFLSGSSTYLLVKSESSKKIAILNNNLGISRELSVSQYVLDGDSFFTHYDPISAIVFIGSFTAGASTYFVSLDTIEETPQFSFVTKVTFPKSFHPLEFSISKNFEQCLETGQVVDLYIFHTKGLSILPVKLISPHKENELSQGVSNNVESVASAASDKIDNTGLETQSSQGAENYSLPLDLSLTIQKRLSKYRASPAFPKDVISTESLQAFETILVESGVIDSLYDNILSRLSNKFESRIQRLERALKADEKADSSIPDLGEVGSTGDDYPLTAQIDDSFSDFVSPESLPSEHLLGVEEVVEMKDEDEPRSDSTVSNISHDSQDSQDRFSESYLSQDKSEKYETGRSDPFDGFPLAASTASLAIDAEVAEPPRDLTSQEYILLSAIENHDLNGAVRIATTNVSHVSLTRVLDTYVSEDDTSSSGGLDSNRESQLIDSLLSGDPLMLLSFIAVLSSDITKKDATSNLATCLNWLQKLIVLINDNFTRYTAYASLISQVYLATKRILQELPSSEYSPVAESLIQELDRTS